MELPGIWAFDAAMSKSVRISESKTILVRMDATNVLNHPNVGNCAAPPTVGMSIVTTGPQCTPTLNINGTNPFGFIQTKGDQTRQFKGTVRLNF